MAMVKQVEGGTFGGPGIGAPEGCVLSGASKISSGHGSRQTPISEYLPRLKPREGTL